MFASIVNLEAVIEVFQLEGLGGAGPLFARLWACVRLGAEWGCHAALSDAFSCESKSIGCQAKAHVRHFAPAGHSGVGLNSAVSL